MNLVLTVIRVPSLLDSGFSFADTHTWKRNLHQNTGMHFVTHHTVDPCIKSQIASRNGLEGLSGANLVTYPAKFRLVETLELNRVDPRIRKHALLPWHEPSLEPPPSPPK